MYGSMVMVFMLYEYRYDHACMHTYVLVLAVA